MPKPTKQPLPLAPIWRQEVRFNQLTVPAHERDELQRHAVGVYHRLQVLPMPDQRRALAEAARCPEHGMAAYYAALERAVTLAELSDEELAKRLEAHQRQARLLGRPLRVRDTVERLALVMPRKETERIHAEGNARRSKAPRQAPADAALSWSLA
jgi:hypothetical protein